MSRYRHLSADAVILIDGGIVLIERDRSPSKGCWVLPGGMVEDGETAREAAEREAREETGLDVEALEFVGLFDNPDRDERGNVSAAYLCRPLDPEPEPQPVEEATAAGLFDPRDLPEPVGFDHTDIVAEALRGLDGG